MLRKGLTILGSIVILFGTVFHLQGQAVVGPESSFMYSNPDWITYGIQIVVAGIIIVSSGIVFTVIKRN